MNKPLVFTKRFNESNYRGFITTEESIFHNNRNIPINAIWDTGSSESVISSRLVKELKLLPNGKSNVASSGKEYASNIYKVTVEIAGEKRFEVHATESEAIEKRRHRYAYWYGYN